MLTQLPSGTVLAFEYQKDGQWQPRIGVLWSVRDMRSKPLETKTVVEKPDVERSRFLLKVWDLARRDFRHFYAARIRNWEPTDLKAVLAVATKRMGEAA